MIRAGCGIIHTHPLPPLSSTNTRDTWHTVTHWRYSGLCCSMVLRHTWHTVWRVSLRDKRDTLKILWMLLLSSMILWHTWHCVTHWQTDILEKLWTVLPITLSLWRTWHCVTLWMVLLSTLILWHTAEEDQVTVSVDFIAWGGKEEWREGVFHYDLIPLYPRLLFPLFPKWPRG